jgi:hypothetical protein
LSNTVFDHLNNLFYKNKLTYDKKDVNAHMISLWLSHDSSLLPIIDKINPYIYSMADELVYEYYYHSIPKGKRYIKWTKGEKNKEKDKTQDMRKVLGMSKMEFRKFKGLIT